MWGITEDGRLYNTYDITNTWELFARIPKHETPVLELFLYRNAFGEPALHALTVTALFVFDVENERFLKSDVTFPRSDRNGKGAVVWRGDLYIPVGNQVYRYGGGATPVLSVVGPGRDSGIPWEGDSQIVKFMPSHNFLLAAVQNLESDDPQGTSHILAYDTVSWKSIWTPNNHRVLTDIFTSTIYGDYSVWLGTRYTDSNGDLQSELKVIDLAVDILNPSLPVPNRRYASSGEMITPWFNASEADLQKIALRVKAECVGTSEDETITIEYALDNSDVWTEIGTLTSNGLHEFLFESKDNPVGTLFSDIRFRVRMDAVAASAGLSPDLLSLSLEFDKYLPPTWAYTFRVDMEKTYQGRTPMAMKNELLAAGKRKILMPFFYYQNTEDSEDLESELVGPTYVEVERLNIAEATGQDERGNAIVTVVEL